jgi:hypothetical protein
MNSARRIVDAKPSGSTGWRRRRDAHWDRANFAFKGDYLGKRLLISITHNNAADRYAPSRAITSASLTASLRHAATQIGGRRDSRIEFIKSSRV